MIPGPVTFTLFFAVLLLGWAGIALGDPLAAAGILLILADFFMALGSLAYRLVFKRAALHRSAK